MKGPALSLALLIAEPMAAGLGALIAYPVLANYLPRHLVNVFPPGIDGAPPAVTVETLATPFHWLGVVAALAFLAEAAVLGRRAYRTYRAWQSGAAPSCPECGGVMKRKRTLWRCYQFPRCAGTQEMNR